MLITHLHHHAKFSHSRSNHSSLNVEILENFDPSRTFKVTETELDRSATMTSLWRGQTTSN